MMQIAQDNQYISTFLECEGNLPLACERLNTTRAKFLYELSLDPGGLRQAIQTLLLVNLAYTFTKVQDTLLSLSEHLEPKDAARAYTQLAQTLGTITSNQAPVPPVQLNQFNFQQLPPEVKQALSILSATSEEPSSAKTIDSGSNGYPTHIYGLDN